MKDLSVSGMTMGLSQIGINPDDKVRFIDPDVNVLEYDGLKKSYDNETVEIHTKYED